MASIIKACRKYRLLQQGLNLLFSFFFCVFRYTLTQIRSLLGRRSSYKLLLTAILFLT